MPRQNYGYGILDLPDSAAESTPRISLSASKSPMFGTVHLSDRSFHLLQISISAFTSATGSTAVSAFEFLMGL